MRVRYNSGDIRMAGPNLTWPVVDGDDYLGAKARNSSYIVSIVLPLARVAVPPGGIPKYALQSVVCSGRRFTQYFALNDPAPYAHLLCKNSAPLIPGTYSITIVATYGAESVTRVFTMMVT